MSNLFTYKQNCLIPTGMNRPVRGDIFLTVRIEKTFSLTIQLGPFETAFSLICNPSIHQYVYFGQPKLLTLALSTTSADRNTALLEGILTDREKRSFEWSSNWTV